MASPAKRKPTAEAVEEPIEDEEAADQQEDRQATHQANRSPKRGLSRLPLPANPPPQQSPLTMATIAAKLAASEREADAARVRAKLKAARSAKRLSLAPPATAQPVPSATTRSLDGPTAIEEESGDPVKKDLSLAEATGAEVAEAPKRKRERRASKVASRRRSTLSPWELESLILGNMPTTPAR